MNLSDYPKPADNTTTGAASFRAVDQAVSWLASHASLRATVLALRQARNDLIDRWLNIRTDGLAVPRRRTATQHEDFYDYQAIDYLLLYKYMRSVRLRPSDVVFDIGCGMGRVICAMARRPVRRCVGIEFDVELADIAARNARTLRGRRAEIVIHTMDACEADYSEGTVFWLYNPFGAETMKTVLHRIEMSWRMSPRPIMVIYAAPKQVHVLEQAQWLRRSGTSHSPLHRRSPATYWRSRDELVMSAMR